MAERKRRSIRRTVEELTWDLWIVVPALGLVFFGVIMVYSASAGLKFPERPLKTQMIAAVIGVVAMVLLQRIDYHRFANPLFVYGFLLFCISLLSVVFLFTPIKGARRWISISGYSFQPSEFAKLALIIFLAWFLARRESEGKLQQYTLTVLPAGVILAIVGGLIYKEPDLGTLGVLGVVAMAMYVIAGAPVKKLLLFLPLLVFGVFYAIWSMPYRRARIFAFLDPEADRLGNGYHILQSLKAIGSGGINGLGFGKGRQKLSFLPEPNTDFIFPVIAEELGLIGATTLILVIGLLIWRGLRAGYRAPDTVGRLLSVGITTWIAFQAFFNISVVLKLLPTKGLTLPLISAGGTSLIVVMMGIGILLNISAQGDLQAQEEGA
ncbi:MAG: putative lipid II flippase FtsW [Acidobacteriota bacterium]